MCFKKCNIDVIESRMEEIKNDEIRIAECYENAEYILDNIDEQFEKATRLEKQDIAFLFLAISLQCVRQYLITNVKERLDDQEAAKQAKGDKKEKSDRHHRYYNPSLQEIISNPVPFDAIKQSEKIKEALNIATIAKAKSIRYIDKIRNYFTSSKINISEYQIDKHFMVQIWFLKFIKSILDVIPMVLMKSINTKSMNNYFY